MHVKPPSATAGDLKVKGILYVVATPIGNMADITLRAIQTLNDVNLVAAEDTRHTGRLLSYHKIKKPLISYHEHNEVKRSAELVARLNSGESIALVSDAGTPTVSDPGYRLVKQAVENKITVVPIPGVSAAMAAVSASGLPTDAFVFFGFLSRKKGKRQKELKAVIDERKTLIFYESPRRMLDFLNDMVEILGDRNGVLARELTKRYEAFTYGRLTEIIDAIKAGAELKGECTLVVAGNTENEESSPEALRKDIINSLRDQPGRLSDVARKLAGRHGFSKNKVYEEALKLKKSTHESD
jgi:16S rRNA (cytidine1402-2'-O)-methyltransferase